MWSTETYMMLILLIGQMAQCILSSRCTKISSPCFTIERDVIPANEVSSRLQRARSNSQPSVPASFLDMREPQEPQIMHPTNENNV